jgi:hypothetical protein
MFSIHFRSAPPMPTRNPSAKYSRHGSQLFQDKFRIYHQGGLDCYCGFYAIFNLINFLHFKQIKKVDFVGESDFEALNAILDLPSFKRFFPETPFGGEGVEAPTLIGALYLALESAKLKGRARIEEDASIPVNNRRQRKYWFRIGVEKAFAPPHDVLGLAAVREDDKDTLEHWVVFVGKSHLENTEIDPKDSDGVVLDSDRDYLYWKHSYDESNNPCIEIARSGQSFRRVEWISSFVSVSVA